MSEKPNKFEFFRAWVLSAKPKVRHFNEEWRMKNKELSITPTKKPQSPLFDLEAFQLFIESLSKGNSSKNVPFSIRFYSHEWHTAATHSLPIGGTGWHVSSLPDNQQIWQHLNYNTVYHNFYHQMQFVGISDILNLFGGWTPKRFSKSNHFSFSLSIWQLTNTTTSCPKNTLGIF